MKGEKTWKVCHIKQNGEFVSAINLNTMSRDGFITRLYYNVGEVTIADPKSLGVFCFSSLDAAEGFRNSQYGGSLVVFEARGYGKKIIEPFIDYEVYFGTGFCPPVVDPGPVDLSISNPCSQVLRNQTLKSRAAYFFRAIERAGRTH